MELTIREMGVMVPSHKKQTTSEEKKKERRSVSHLSPEFANNQQGLLLSHLRLELSTCTEWGEELEVDSCWVAIE